MRTSHSLATTVVALALASTSAQESRIDPESLLSSKFQFTANELGQVRQGQPVVKVKADGTELSLVGAIKLSGKKERLADWVKNIEHFRRSAELGVAQVVPAPPAAAGFTGVTLDASDVSELQHCAAGKCAIRVSPEAIGRLKGEVQWGAANASNQANDIFRQMLLGYTNAYLANGSDAETRALVGKATTLTEISPELAAYLQRYPQAPLPSSDQLFYWSSTPASSTSIVSVHHLTVYKPRPSEIWIADKNLYASRYFDAGVLVIGMYDAPDGNGFYAVAGSRMKSSQLGGVAGTVLRRQIQRSASDSVKTYLEWIRDSLRMG